MSLCRFHPLLLQGAGHSTGGLSPFPEQGFLDPLFSYSRLRVMPAQTSVFEFKTTTIGNATPSVSPETCRIPLSLGTRPALLDELNQRISFRMCLHQVSGPGQVYDFSPDPGGTQFSLPAPVKLFFLKPLESWPRDSFFFRAFQNFYVNYLSSRTHLPLLLRDLADSSRVH